MPTRPNAAHLAAVTDEDGRARCTATSKRSGDRCRNAPRRGATVCRMHGGSAPQVVRSARQRLAAMVDPALDALHAIVTGESVIEYDDKGRAYVVGTADADRLRAATAILDRTGYHARLGLDVDAAAEELGALLDELAAERPAS